MLFTMIASFLGDLFIKNIGDLKLVPEKSTKQFIAQIEKEMDQDQTIFKIVIDELDKILKQAVIDPDTLKDVWTGPDSVVNDAIDKIFNSIKISAKEFPKQADKETYVADEKANFERMLESTKSNGLSLAEKYAIITYSYDATVNFFLFHCEKESVKQFDKIKTGKVKEALKLQAMLLQSALNKLPRIKPVLGVRFECARESYKKDEEMTLLRFTSVGNADNIPLQVLDKQLQETQDYKKRDCATQGYEVDRMNFRNTDNGVEIRPWVRPIYLYEREILYPVGSKFQVKDVLKPKGKDYTTDYNLSSK